MLLSLPKFLPVFLRRRLTIAFCPAHIVVMESKLIARIPVNAELNINQPDWQAPLAALANWLEKNKLGATQIDLIISDQFACYALIPWPENVSGSVSVYKAAEMSALARIHFEILFGDAIDNYQIQVDMPAYGQAGIGCALDKSMVASLLDLCATHGLQLASLQPYFIHVFNRWRSRINNKINHISDGLFAVVEGNQCVLACYKNAAWHSIRSVKFDLHLETSLERLIQREKLLQGLDESAETTAIDVMEQTDACN